MLLPSFIVFHSLYRLINELSFTFVNTFLVMINGVSNTDIWHYILVLVCPTLIIVLEICKSFLGSRFQPVGCHMRYKILLCAPAKEASFSGQPLAVNLLARIYPAWYDIFNK